ncbi:MAG: plastocyanin/azurin family copper-binding protein [Candidatus Methanoperedens sp.]|nr:plastocyanin/azurin family copper-binding protein [Candidatus Methanoperedens sp.]CAG0960520.1 Amicyanin-alpha [Methanosarcinales archaeon]
MNNFKFSIAVLTLLIVGISTAGASGQTSAWHVLAGGETTDMKLQGLGFYPGVITINAGDSINWTVGGSEPHTVSFLSGASIPEPGSPETLLPVGGFNYNGTGHVSSGLIIQGMNYTLKFTEPGVYTYQCLIHPGMGGVVIVQPNGSSYPFTQDQYAAQGLKESEADLDAGQHLVDNLSLSSTPGPNGTTIWQAAADIPLPLKTDVVLSQKNNSEANGSIALNLIDPGMLEVQVKLSGLASNSVHPAHIHAGTCEAGGPVVYPLNNLTADAQGNVTNTTIINGPPWLAIQSRGWFVNVHQGPTMSDAGATPIACSDVEQNYSSYMRYIPDPLTIHTDDTVVWTQMNSMMIHTVTFPVAGQPVPEFILPNLSINPAAAAPAGGSVYNGTDFFNSGVLSPGQNYTLTFTKPGTYDYLCLLHDEMGMKGKVIVLPPANVTKAVRIIEKESLRPGESTNITVDISSNMSQALALHEIIPAGWNLTRLSDDADAFKNSTSESIWFNVSPGINKTVIYRLTAPDNASIGTYHINGTISSASGVIATVGGNNIITLDTLDIIAFYRRLGSETDRVETTDVLAAADDWRTGTAPAGFARPITSSELSDLIKEWAGEVIPTALKITSFTPSETIVDDNLNANRTFNITVNQVANVKWFINGTEVFNESGVTTSSYANTSSAKGIWNITVAASNSKGSDMHTWVWTVTSAAPPGDQTVENAEKMLMQGKQTFRFDTFGDEAFWGDTLKIHEAIAGAANGGTGPGVSPKTALAVGLKVDVSALPLSLIEDIKNGSVDLDDPATTLALLKLNAVVGINGSFDSEGNLSSIGITCAVCHSTVDDSFSSGIGNRLDGWANRDLNVGAIVNLSSNLTPVANLLGVSEPTVRTVLKSWGPGKFDAELFLDGKAFNPQQVTDGIVTGQNVSGATLIPNAYGLAGFDQNTWTGTWGTVTYWNAFVANLEMHGKGTFFDPRLDNASKFPIAAANKFGHMITDPDDDLITSKLPALQFYQLSLSSPVPQPGIDFDKEAAVRGDELFSEKAQCNNCHTEPIWTEPGRNLHKPSEIGIDDFQAERAPDGLYKTMNLGGIFVRESGKFMNPENKGGFYHDGRFKTLMEVVNHYNKSLTLNLSDQEKSDLVEYLKSLSSKGNNISEGREIFRYDTFGDEAFWGDTLKIHEAIAGAANGGTGLGVSPKTALAVGLKVDVSALPLSLIEDIKNGSVDLDDPATTLALLKLNAVVGINGSFDSEGNLSSIGITCAVCHSTVDDSFSSGIGNRLDGWANRDLNVGAIVNLSPDLSPVAKLLNVSEPTVRTVLNSWGPGKFDAELFLDGKAFNPQQVTDGVVTGQNVSGATLIPNAYGLGGFNQNTWTGSWGTVTYWNAFVANIEMHGKGTFFDPRLDNASKFPIAAANKFGHLRTNPDDDLITSKLPALQFYQLALPSPVPQPGIDFDKEAAVRGDELFSKKAQCNNCHTEPIWTEPGWNLHKPSEIGIDDFQAERAPDGLYKTMNLGGIFVRESGKFMNPQNKGRFYHDGRFKTLMEVVNHYDKLLTLGLSDQEKSDLVEYLKSLSSP